MGLASAPARHFAVDRLGLHRVRVFTAIVLYALFQKPPEILLFPNSLSHPGVRFVIAFLLAAHIPNLLAHLFGFLVNALLMAVFFPNFLAHLFGCIVTALFRAIRVQILTGLVFDLTSTDQLVADSRTDILIAILLSKGGV